jgi:hypothetical protein
MKLVIRTGIFHLLCILTFACLYLYMADQFELSFKTNKQDDTKFLDYFLLSTTIQAGVGYTDLFPVSYYSKIAVIIQQFLVMLTHIITLYVFTL